MKTILKLALVATLMASSASAASILSLVPAAPTVLNGQPLFVDLTISGLGASSSPSLGAWIIGISYDSALFSITDPDVTLGPLLGTPPGEVFEVVDTSTPGLVTLSQTSLLAEAALDALQPASFSLAKLEFTGIALGTGVFDFTTTDLSDAGFPATTIDVKSTVAGEATVVPEPSTLTLFGFGAFTLVGLAALRRRKRQT